MAATKVMLLRAVRNLLSLSRLQTPNEVNRVVTSWNHVSPYSSSESTAAESGAYSVGEVDEENAEELEVDRTDISGLPKKLRDRMSHVSNPPDQESIGYKPEHLLREFRRMCYAKYGRASGVNPGEMWPTREELAELIEEEQEFEPTLQELWATAADKRQAVQDKRKDRCVVPCFIMYIIDIML